jgi:hypothetical protein
MAVLPSVVVLVKRIKALFGLDANAATHHRRTGAGFSPSQEGKATLGEILLNAPFNSLREASFGFSLGSVIGFCAGGDLVHLCAARNVD